MSSKAPVNLMKKLLAARTAIGKVKKTGYNSHGGYHYVTEQDLVEAVRDVLNEQGIIILTSSKITDMRPSVRVKNGVSEHSGFITSVETVHTFIDTDSGEQITVNSVGQGHDTLGDKGSNKAIVSCFKYMLSKNFLIETNDDPERDTPSGHKPKGTMPKPTSKAAPPSTGFGAKKTTSEKKVEAPKDIKPSSGFGMAKVAEKVKEAKQVTEVEEVDF